MIQHHKQHSISDCGLSCLKTILSYFNIQNNGIEEYFDLCGDQGFSIYDLEKILREYGVESESYEITNISLIDTISLPYIAVVSRNSLLHYIVVLDYKKDRGFIVSDPAKSTFSNLKYDDFISIFTGIVLIPVNNMNVKSKKRTICPKVKDDYSGEIYIKFIKELPILKRMNLFFLGCLKIILPIFLSLFMQYITVNIISIKMSTQIFMVIFVVLCLIVYKVISMYEVYLRVSLENDLLNNILNNYYEKRLQKNADNRNYDYILGYFWNLLTSVSGILQKFYMKIYLCLIGISVLLIFWFNYMFGIITCLFLLFLFLYNSFKLLHIEDIQRGLVSSSSNFTNLVESSIDGTYDILSFSKVDDFRKEFNKRLSVLLQKKMNYENINNQILTSIQVFSISLICLLILVSHIFYFDTTIIDYANIVFIILLLSTILQPLFITCLSYFKSKYSMNFVHLKSSLNEKILMEKNLPINKIDSVVLENISATYDDKYIFDNVNVQFSSGNIYVITGNNGSGKSTLLKILHGFLNPAQGYIYLNNLKFESLIDTDVQNHVALYTNEFRVFAGSVEQNITFNMFDGIRQVIDESSFIDLPLSYLINSNGRNLSQGQRQKILLLRTLNQDRDIYIFDEPTTNLDSRTKNEFIKMLMNLRKIGKIVIVVSHDDDLIKISSNILNMDQYTV